MTYPMMRTLANPLDREIEVSGELLFDVSTGKNNAPEAIELDGRLEVGSVLRFVDGRGVEFIGDCRVYRLAEYNLFRHTWTARSLE